MTRIPQALIALLLAGPAAAQAPEQFRISVSVDLVLLNATVHDHKGRPVMDLAEKDFEVFEDGVRQPLRVFSHEDTPVTVGLVVDHSGSMRPKLRDVVVSAKAFIDASSARDRMFVVNFNENVTMGLPKAIPFTNRADQLTQAISNAPAAGQTALYDAAAVAFQHLETGGPDKKALIVISDGGDNASRHKLAELLNMAEQSSALVYAIGIFDAGDADSNPDVLKKLARISGGEAFFPHEVGEIPEICEHIAKEIRHQYTLGYVSTAGARPGAFRKIKVNAASPSEGKLSVRTRSGYMSPEASPK